jgi:hypothetical protein
MAQSDPICSSAGCNYASEKGWAGHPLNYFVPDFGVDQDIKDSQSHEAAAIKLIKTPAVKSAPAEVAPAAGKAAAPVEAAKKEAAPAVTKTEAAPAAKTDAPDNQAKLEMFMNEGSDPSWNSADGHELRHSNPFNKTEEAVAYPESSAETLDSDIKSTQGSLKAMETKMGAWTFPEEQHFDPSIFAQQSESAPAKKKAAPAKKDSGKKSYHEHSKAHFKNNYKNSAAKRKARNLLKE